jgi:N-methylhydantoinase A
MLGVDVGGTFTDLALFEQETGDLTLAKVPSTPADPSAGVIHGLHKLIEQHGAPPQSIGFLIHGTTVATNAVLEGKGVATALLATEGFGDILDIVRQDRPRLYDWRALRPPPLVPRSQRWEVRERTLYDGQEALQLDEDRVRQVIAEIRQRGIRSIAVCYLHAYANPAHEQRTAKLIAQEYPEASVSLSSDILPEIKEYERTSTTVMNAAVMPVVERYLSRLSQAAARMGVASRLHVMQSNGGIMTAETASRKSVNTIMSGLAGGVLGGVTLAKEAGFENVITIDMGGTSFDISLAYQGRIRLTREAELGGHAITVPMVDVHTLGAGGGSIAWIDAGGALQVGPQSAGADPGPACYGHGGQQPTVTDANLVLGRLNPHHLLGGAVPLQLELARQAIQQHVADPLGMSLDAAAEGIVKIVNANMLKGIRIVSIERGYNPREFTVVAFGGGGPVHAADLAYELGANTVMVPVAPGITSAIGLLMADFRHDYSRTYLVTTDSVDLEGLNRAFDALQEQATEQLLAEGVPKQSILLWRSVEMRYRGQGYNLEVGVPDGQLDASSLRRVNDAFHQQHQATYGYSRPEEVTEFVNLRLAGMGQLPKPRAKQIPSAGDDPGPARVGRRAVYFNGQWYDSPIYARELLRHGHHLSGPAIVEQLDSTTVIPTGWSAAVDLLGNLVLMRRNERGMEPGTTMPTSA